MLERLQMALSGDAPHVLVLDGLERVQSEGDRARRGELEDLQLKRLVRALAGGVGNARALVTSRFPLVDLAGWTGAGHRAIALDDLELPVALDVLRAWGVKGDDAALARVVAELNVGGFYHALSVAVLASYIANFGSIEFSLEDARESDDPKARRLHRILEQYAKALTPAERDLLARLSLFPRGVKVELLGWIVQSGGEVAGALIGLVDRELVRLLERLRALGLVFRYDTDGQIVYSAHPFLREFFRNLLGGTKPESVHESVRSRLAPSLEARPSTKPRDAVILDRYELLIEETLLAGRVQEALYLYHLGLGGYDNLGKVLGDNARGLRILARFVPRDDFSLIEPQLSRHDGAVAVTDLGLFAKELGDLVRARVALAHGQLRMPMPSAPGISRKSSWSPDVSGEQWSTRRARLRSTARLSTRIPFSGEGRRTSRWEASPRQSSTSSAPPNWKVNLCTASAASRRPSASSFWATGPEHLARRKLTAKPASSTTGTPPSVAATLSSPGSFYPMTPPEPPNTYKTPAPSPTAPAKSNSNSAASMPPANSSATSAITLNPSRKRKLVSSWRTLAAADRIRSTSACP
jgi:hypothetical protein